MAAAGVGLLTTSAHSTARSPPTVARRSSANSPANSPKHSPEVELYSARVHVANEEEWREVVMAACDAAANPAPAAEGGARAAAQQARAC